MKLNFYALFMLTFATYGFINAIKYTGTERIAHDNGKAYWNKTKNKAGLNEYCERLYTGNVEQIKACKLAATTTE